MLRVSWFITVLVLGLMLWSVSPAAAADQVPLKGILFLVTMPANTCENGDSRLSIKELGNFNHLGAVTAVATVCLANDLSFTGEATYTAANGDVIYASFAGRLAPVSGTLFSLEGEHLSIAGGTGRFAGASGGAIVTGTVDLATGDGVHQIDGTISTVGSLK